MSLLRGFPIWGSCALPNSRPPLLQNTERAQPPPEQSPETLLHSYLPFWGPVLLCKWVFCFRLYPGVCICGPRITTVLLYLPFPRAPLPDHCSRSCSRAWSAGHDAQGCSCLQGWQMLCTVCPCTDLKVRDSGPVRAPLWLRALRVLRAAAGGGAAQRGTCPWLKPAHQRLAPFLRSKALKVSASPL